MSNRRWCPGTGSRDSLAAHWGGGTAGFSRTCFTIRPRPFNVRNLTCFSFGPHFHFQSNGNAGSDLSLHHIMRDGPCHLSAHMPSQSWPL